MTSYNPHTLLREMDAAMRRAQWQATKALTLAGMVRQAKSDAARERTLQTLETRLRKVDGCLAPALLTQWRQEYAEPRQRQEAPGLPDGLICKKCGEVKDEKEFFYDDRQGCYGYTHRCHGCRRTSRKGKPGARADAKAYARGPAASEDAA